MWEIGLKQNKNVLSKSYPIIQYTCGTAQYYKDNILYNLSYIVTLFAIIIYIARLLTKVNILVELTIHTSFSIEFQDVSYDNKQ